MTGDIIVTVIDMVIGNTRLFAHMKCYVSGFTARSIIIYYSFDVHQRIQAYPASYTTLSTENVDNHPNE